MPECVLARAGDADQRRWLDGTPGRSCGRQGIAHPGHAHHPSTILTSTQGNLAAAEAESTTATKELQDYQMSGAALSAAARGPDPKGQAMTQRVANAKVALEAARNAFADAPEIPAAEKVPVLKAARIIAQQDYDRAGRSLQYYATWGAEYIQDQQVRVDAEAPGTSSRATQEYLLQVRKDAIAEDIRVATAEQAAALVRIQAFDAKIAQYGGA